MRFGLLSKAVCCLSLFMINPTVAKELNSLQYDARLCSAQLLVIKGDLTRFQHKETKEHHKTGLKQRIKGTLGTLEWLCRQHSYSTNLVGLESSLHREKLNKIKLTFKAKNWQVLHKDLDALVSTMPLNIKSFEFQNFSQRKLKTSISINKHYCQACHNQPSDNSETPAYSLFEMAKRMSRKELLARMIVGIHGTPKIALRNPLTDDDITGLVTYFTNTKKAKH